MPIDYMYHAQIQREVDRFVEENGIYSPIMTRNLSKFGHELLNTLLGRAKQLDAERDKGVERAKELALLNVLGQERLALLRQEHLGAMRLLDELRKAVRAVSTDIDLIEQEIKKEER